MTSFRSYLVTGVSFLLFMVMTAGIMSGCSVGLTDIIPEGLSGGSEETDILEALKEDRFSDADRESITRQLLEQCTFYQGRVTIFENQKWTSRGTDGSSGVGDSTVSTDEILVYDPETKKTYIVSRYMSAVGQHGVTVNDMHGNFLQYADIVHSGDLYEYYGTGLLWRKQLEDGIASESVLSRYTLNFGANPVRMDNERSVIYTYPLPRQVDWVTYVSIAGTDRRGGARIFPPEENNKNPDIDLVPGLTNVSDSNPYNSGETWVYEATDRIWTPSGEFYYDYYKISYDDAMSEIDRLEREANAAKTFGEMAENQPPAWQETANLADGLNAIASAAEGLESMTNILLPEDVIDALQARNAADALANEQVIRRFMAEFQPAPASSSGGSVESATPRSLEGVVIESSDENGAGPEQKNLKNKYTEIQPHIEDIYTEYTSIYSSMQQTVNRIRDLSGSPELPVNSVTQQLREFKAQVAAAVKLNQTTEIILGDTLIVLNDLNLMGGVDKETSYGELNRLFSLWQETFAFVENTSIDMAGGVALPTGYPESIVPVMDGALIAVAQRIPGDAGEGDGYTLTLKTNRTPEEVARYYTGLLQGESEFSSFSFSGITTLAGEKQGYEFSVAIMANNLGGSEKTAVQVSLVPLE